MKLPVGVLVIVVLLLALAIMPGGSCGTGMDVPPALRSRAEADFPEFEIVDATASTTTGSASPHFVEQDVMFTLRHKSFPFYMTQQYDQAFYEGDSPPGWTLNTTSFNRAAPSFSGTLDSRARSFVEFFAHDYDVFVYQGASGPYHPEQRHRFTAWVYPRRGARIEFEVFGCSSRHGRSMTFEYDPETNAWRRD